MERTIKTLMACGTLALMAACGGSSGGGGTTVIDDPIEDPVFGRESTLGSESNVQARRSFISAGYDLDRTGPIAGVPNGQATYRGSWSSGLSVSDNSDIGGLMGDMTMNVNIGGGTYEVNGQIDNVNTTQGNTGLEALNGSLSIQGEIGGLDKEFDDTAFSGNLTGYFGGEDELTLNLNGAVSGGMRNRAGFRNNGSALVGNTSGLARFSDGSSVRLGTGSFRADRQN